MTIETAAFPVTQKFHFSYFYQKGKINYEHGAPPVVLECQYLATTKFDLLAVFSRSKAD
jgi:hypothetical protein